MSEYWVSKKKYFCQYCDIFIADDAPSRSHHENGMRHKGNKERFVKSLYKAGEKRKKDEEEERREMKHVEAAAQRAYALDVGAGRAGIGGSEAPAPKAAPAPPKKPSNPYTNYTTAQSLGYTDPDAGRIQVELERRRTQGVAGDWELVPSTSTPVPLPSTSSLDVPSDVKPPTDGTAPVAAGTKREAEAPVEDDEDSRAWKLRKKTARLGDIYDPGDIPIKLKVKKQDEGLDAIGGASGSGLIPVNVGLGSSNATDVPKWTKLAWKKPGEASSTPDSDVVPPSEIPTPLSTKIELDASLSSPNADLISTPDARSLETEPVSAKIEDPPPPLPGLSSNGGGGGLFKKRKGRGGVTGRRDHF